MWFNPRTSRAAETETATIKTGVNAAERKARQWYWLPDPSTRRGAAFYAVAGPVAVAAAATVGEFMLHHVHFVLYIS